jgi:hypothetical protein
MNAKDYHEPHRNASVGSPSGPVVAANAPGNLVAVQSPDAHAKCQPIGRVR